MSERYRISDDLEVVGNKHFARGVIAGRDYERERIIKLLEDPDTAYNAPVGLPVKYLVALIKGEEA